jgi:hypothetical protein
MPSSKVCKAVGREILLSPNEAREVAHKLKLADAIWRVFVDQLLIEFLKCGLIFSWKNGQRRIEAMPYGWMNRTKRHLNLLCSASK